MFWFRRLFSLVWKHVLLLTTRRSHNWFFFLRFFRLSYLELAYWWSRFSDAEQSLSVSHLLSRRNYDMNAFKQTDQISTFYSPQVFVLYPNLDRLRGIKTKCRYSASAGNGPLQSAVTRFSLIYSNDYPPYGKSVGFFWILSEKDLK